MQKLKLFRSKSSYDMTQSIFSKKFIFLGIFQQKFQFSEGLMVTHCRALQGCHKHRTTLLIMLNATVFYWRHFICDLPQPLRLLAGHD